MTATIHRLSAGDGYTYLTRQVAAQDATTLVRSDLADYYSERGERPGIWFGDGVAGLYNLHAGERVTEEQMRALFGEARQPKSDELAAELRRTTQWGDPRIKEALRVGGAFREYAEGPLTKALAVAYREHNEALGVDPKATIDDEIREQIRTRVARDLFREEYKRSPQDEQELTGFVAREGRKDRQSVAGFDVTFSPVKSVSTLWAVADRATAEQVRLAHEAAVTSALEWMQNESIYTRLGRDGVRQMETLGMVATRFEHRDTRAGDPDLHTHVAIANRVQEASTGKWRTLDSRMMFKTTVAASERYNSALERELNDRLGLSFAAREETVAGRKQVIREVVGVAPELADAWSSRTHQIEARASELAQEFTDKHHRVPSPVEMIRLRQQANLDTREAKKEPRSENEQRAAWHAQAAQVLGGESGVQAMLAAVQAASMRHDRVLSRVETRQLAAASVRQVQLARAEFNDIHVRAEIERQVRAQNVAPAMHEAIVEDVMAAVWADRECVRVERKPRVVEPSALRRVDGESVYEVAHSRRWTTRRQLAQETYIVDQAALHDGMALDAVAVQHGLEGMVAQGVKLNAGQADLVRSMATSGARVQLALAPAGSGKTTSMRALATLWREQGGSVVGLAPSAVAAEELGRSMGVVSDTLAQLTTRLEHNAALPQWANAIDQRTLVVIDEAGMASTADLHSVIRFVTSRGGSVRLIGDDQQLSAVASGGVLRDVKETAGAVSLRELVRFRDRAEAAATLGLRDGDVEALGFYADRQRIHAAATGNVLDQVFTAWSKDHAAGLQSTMLAYSNEAVDALNERARAERLATVPAAEVGPSVRLASGLEASAGDPIVSRRNDRELRITGTDYVKNGDRWDVREVLQDGSLVARHRASGGLVLLPADYVASGVDLAYATTIHQAQGSTVDTAHVVIDGSEDRQLMYVAMSRGRLESHIYLDAGVDGDEHNIIRPEYVDPRSPVEVLEEIVRRDGAQMSATTQRRLAADPATELALMAPRYSDAPGALAVTLLSESRRAELTEKADRIVAQAWADNHHGDETGAPVVSNDPSWDVLLGSLALIELDGGDALAVFQAAVESREINSAEHLAAMLDWRLHQGETTGIDGAPLPWQREIPNALVQHPEFGSYLTTLAERVSESAQAVRYRYETMPTEDLPRWAKMLDHDRELLAEVAVWRVAQQVSDDDMLPTGPHATTSSLRKYQRNLDKRVERSEYVARKPDPRWVEILDAHDLSHVVEDPYWPQVSRRLTLAARSGADVAAMLTVAVEQDRPLAADHPAAALWFRVAPQVQPILDAPAPDMPEWEPELRKRVDMTAYQRLVDTTAWSDIVHRVEQAAERDHITPTEAISRALDLMQPDTFGTDTGVSYATLPVVLLAQLDNLNAPVTAAVQPDDDVLDVDPLDLATRPGPGDEDDAQALREEAATARTPEKPSDVLVDAGPVPADAPWPFDEPPADDEILPPDPGQDTEPTPSEAIPQPGTSPERIVQLNEIAATYYRGHYPADSAPARYVAERMGSDLRDLDGLVIGYATPGRADLSTWMLRNHDATPDELVDAGLAKYGRDGSLTDRFRDRVMLGLHDADGHLVGFQGRANPTATDVPKYLNTPDTPAFSKGAVLFGLHESNDALRNGAVIARTEGPFDALAITLAGHGTTVGVAPLGTALTDAQADLIASSSTARIVMEATDTDHAGIAAAERDYWRLTSRGLDPRRLVLMDRAHPEQNLKDPADAYKTDPDTLSLTLAMPEISPSLASVLISQRIAADSEHLAMESVPAIVAAARDSARIITALDPAQWPEHVEAAAAQLPTPDAVSLVAAETLHMTAPARLDEYATNPDQAAAVEQLIDATSPEVRATMDDLMARLAANRAEREARRAAAFGATDTSENMRRARDIVQNLTTNRQSVDDSDEDTTQRQRPDDPHYTPHHTNDGPRLT